MKAVVLAAALAAGLLIAVASADGKRSPRLEKLALTAADNARAKKALVRLSDLTPGWQQRAATPDDGSAPPCGWMDFSRFTITGKAESDFRLGAAGVFSEIEIYASPAQARDDFKMGTRAGTATCLGAAIVKDIGATARLLSAREVAAPKIGERTVDYELAFRVGENTFYAGVVAFLRDRAIGAVMTISAGRRLDGTATLARKMAARLSPPTVA
jgi:hypothetical protein